MDADDHAARCGLRAVGQPGLEFASVSVLALAILAVVYWRPPLVARVLPSCPFHDATGLYCPGCGATRALYDLMHGDPLAALGMNPLLVLALPYFAYIYVKAAARLILRRAKTPAARSLLQGVVCRALWVAIPAYWILRNVPRYPFTYLAPH